MDWDAMIAGACSMESIMFGSESEAPADDVAASSISDSKALALTNAFSRNSVTEDTKDSDRKLFSTWDWNVAEPSAPLAVTRQPTEQDRQIAKITEHAAIFYLKRLVDTVKLEDSEEPEWFHKFLFNFANHVIRSVDDGRQPYAKKEWLSTTQDEINEEMDKLGDIVDVRLIRAVGENLPGAVLGKTRILEHIMKDNLLNDFYVHSRGIAEHTDVLANVIQQLAHRYGALNFIELGGGSGGATRKILTKIGNSFKSYMFTDISAGFVAKAQNTFADHGDKIDFKVLDLGKDVIEQGFVRNSYDVIVAPAVIHRTESLEQTLANIRQLLRPGGFLIALELTSHGPIRMCFSMCGLPVFWLGHKDGRVLGPCASPERWDKELCQVGFSGIDTMTLGEGGLDQPCFVFATRAIDARVAYLDHPTLASNIWQPREAIILGGQSQQNLSLDVVSKLQACNIQTVCFKTIEDIEDHKIAPQSAVISLIDLEEPIFQNISSKRLQGLQKLLRNAESLLWVTMAYLGNDPYGSMSLGFVRSLVREMPLLQAQIFDVNFDDLPSGQELADALLRVDGAAKLCADQTTPAMLYSQENEVMFRNHQLYIPRLRHMPRANDRFNSSKRVVQRKIDPLLSPVELGANQSGHFLQERPKLKQSRKGRRRTEIKVLCSSAHAVKVAPCAYLFVVCGIERCSDKLVLALTDNNASVVTADQRLTVPLDSPGQKVNIVASVLQELLARYISSPYGGASSIHVHGAPIAVCHRLQRMCREKLINATFSTSREAQDCIWIHPQASPSHIAHVIPSEVLYCVTFEDKDNPTLASLEEALPEECAIERSCQLFTQRPIRQRKAVAALDIDLQSISSHAMANPSLETDHVDLTEINSHGTGTSPYAVIDWTSRSTSARVQPVDSERIFASERTYALFGLTNELGQALCRWMVQHGARHLVLTSRNPKVEESWKEEMRSLGAYVKIYASDITDEDAFCEVYNDIGRTMPQVGGVASGAMVVNDTPVMNMTYENWTQVAQPKMCGSLFLDKYFQDPALEFFIMFSSVAGIHGNKGQSNYSAANMFSTGLVYQRRQKGLRASVLHTGPIAGTVATESSNVCGHAKLDQSDIFTGFAEAILAGQLGETAQPEVVLDEQSEVANATPETDPKFQFVLPHQQEADTGQGKSPDAGLPRAELTGLHETAVLSEQVATKPSLLDQTEDVPKTRESSVVSTSSESSIDSSGPATPNSAGQLEGKNATVQTGAVIKFELHNTLKNAIVQAPAVITIEAQRLLENGS